MATQFFHADDGARIAYSDTGEGLPLLCLAGLTRTMADFDHVAPHLDGCRIIRMDYRGRGQSEWTGPDSYNVPREGRDAINLLDHLGLDRAAVLGTSRGGLIGLLLAAMTHDRLLGLCLNDVGPVIGRKGLEHIFEYVGRNPAQKTHAELAAALDAALPGFANVPKGRWLQDVQRHYDQTPDGLKINYDPALREPFMAAFEGEDPDLWPLWQATAGFPVAVIRGANSDLLSRETVAKMRELRPDLIHAEVPDRAHIPWLDEAESLAVLNAWLAAIRQAAPR